MSHLCKACGRPVVRINDKKPWPEKCAGCKKDAQRQYGREYRNRTRTRIDWSGLKCGRCASSTVVVPRRGRPSKWCRDCLRNVKAEQSRIRKARSKSEGRDRIHAGTCNHCHQAFRSDRIGQKYCSPHCARLASRSRSVIKCSNPSCGKDFARCQAQADAGRKFCCWECFQAVHAAKTHVCHHCRKEFKSKAYKHEWQGKNKYCCRECYRDARWGTKRPRREWSAAAVDRSCRRSLAVSLRKRCKYYGVPFDPACTREAVCERDGWICQQCGVKCHKGRHRFNKRTRKMSRRNAEHDHIVPLAWRAPSKGNTFDNSQCLCRKCNGRKHSKGGGQMRFVLVEC